MTLRVFKTALISLSLALGAAVFAQREITVWRTRLGNTTLSNFDPSRMNALRLPIEVNSLGLRKLSLCLDGRFVVSLEQVGAVIGMGGMKSARVSGHWMIVRAGVTTANLELSPSTMASAGALATAELQRFTVTYRGEALYIDGARWFSRPAGDC